MSDTFTWNLYADVHDMWSLPFMVNAFRAGTIVAVLAAVVGWFMVLRRQSFAGHTLAVVGFPGAAAAVWLGIGVTYGYFTACVVAALVIAVLPARGGRGYTEESAVIGTIQAFALASGMLFVALYKGFLNGTNALLFGSFLGVTQDQVRTVALVAGLVLIIMVVVGRPLLFASIDSNVARAHGLPTRALDAGFLVVLGATAAQVSQVTGALLVFALLVLPPATAQMITARSAYSMGLAVILALVTVWVALFVAYYSPYPIGFWLTTIAFGGYVLAATATTIAARSRRVARTAPATPVEATA